MLRANHVTVHYAGANQAALKGVSLTLEPGQRCALLGASGAGKSTLLRVLAGVQSADRGELHHQASQPRTAGQWRAWRQRIAMVFQDHGVIPRKTVLWHVLLGHLGRRSAWRACWFTPQADLEAAFAALDQVGLLDLAHRRVRDCSGGQRQRVGIARALVQRAEALLADEPIANLDPVTADDVMQRFSDFANPTDGPPRSLLVGLHHVATARNWADRIIALRDGQVCYDGPSTLFDAAAQASVYAATDAAASTPSADGPASPPPPSIQESTVA